MALLQVIRLHISAFTTVDLSVILTHSHHCIALILLHLLQVSQVTLITSIVCTANSLSPAWLAASPMSSAGLRLLTLTHSVSHPLRCARPYILLPHVQRGLFCLQYCRWSSGHTAVRRHSGTGLGAQLSLLLPSNFFHTKLKLSTLSS